MESMEEIEGYTYENERDRKVREADQDDDSFSEASNPSELDFDEKDYVKLDFKGNDNLQQNEEEEEKVVEGNKLLSKDMLKSMISKLENEVTTGMLKRFLMAFSSGVKLEDNEKEKKVIIHDTSTFQSLMVFSFQSVPEILKKYLTDSNDCIYLAKLNKVIHLLKNYVSNYIAFLGKLSDPEMIEFILSNALPLTKFLLYLKPYHVKFLKLLIRIWAESEKSNIQQIGRAHV